MVLTALNVTLVAFAAWAALSGLGTSTEGTCSGKAWCWQEGRGYVCERY